jgi:hypothetical protein
VGTRAAGQDVGYSAARFVVFLAGVFCRNPGAVGFRSVAVDCVDPRGGVRRVAGLPARAAAGGRWIGRQRRAAYYQRGVARLRGEVDRTGRRRARPTTPEEHLYAEDLDLFGRRLGVRAGLRRGNGRRSATPVGLADENRGARGRSSRGRKPFVNFRGVWIFGRTSRFGGLSSITTLAIRMRCGNGRNNRTLWPGRRSAVAAGAI